MNKLDTDALRRALQRGAVARLEIRRVPGKRYALRVVWAEGHRGPCWLHLQRRDADGKLQRSERSRLDGWRYVIEGLEVPASVPVVFPTGREQGDDDT